MAVAKIWSGFVYEDGGATFLARVTKDGVLVLQADLSTITWSVFDDLDSDAPAVATGSATISTSVFDTIQQDGRWELDEEGYNFRYDMAAASFPEETDYRVEFKCTPASGQVFWIPFEATVLPIRTS